MFAVFRGYFIVFSLGLAGCIQVDNVSSFPVFLRQPTSDHRDGRRWTVYRHSWAVLQRQCRRDSLRRNLSGFRICLGRMNHVGVSWRVFQRRPPGRYSVINRWWRFMDAADRPF